MPRFFIMTIFVGVNLLYGLWKSKLLKHSNVVREKSKGK